MPQHFKPEEIEEVAAALPPEEQEEFVRFAMEHSAAAQEASREALVQPVREQARTRSETVGTGSVFTDAALAGMGSEGGSFADPNATPESIARRAAAHMAVLGVGSGSVVPIAQAVGRSYVGGVGGGALGRGLGETAEWTGMAPEGTGEALERIGNVAGVLVGPTRAGGKLIDLAVKRVPWVGRAVAPVARRILGIAAPQVTAPVAAAAAPAAAAATTATVGTSMSREAARAQLEALLGKAVNEGRVAAAAKEAAKGNRQLAEKILGNLQGEGVIAP